MQNVNDIQVGGTHYKAAIQHWDFIELNGLGYLEGCATKYGTRNRKKHESPIQDLEKAGHYIDKLQALHLAGKRNNRRLTVLENGTLRFSSLVIPVEDFCKANDLNEPESELMRLLTHWTDAGDLASARELIDDMLAAVYARES